MKDPCFSFSFSSSLALPNLEPWLALFSFKNSVHKSLGTSFSYIEKFQWYCSNGNVATTLQQKIIAVNFKVYNFLEKQIKWINLIGHEF